MNRGEHDYYHYGIHLAIYGLNWLVWLLTAMVDSLSLRRFYFVTTFLSAGVPFIATPAYLVWLTVVNSIGEDYTKKEFWWSLTGWTAYMFVM